MSLLIVFCQTVAQPSPRPHDGPGETDTIGWFRAFRIGLQLGVSLNHNSPSFSVYSGSDSCGSYLAGITTGSSLALFLDGVPARAESIWFSAGLGLVARSLNLGSQPREFPVRGSNGEISTALKEHRLSARLTQIKLSIGGGLELFSGLRLGVMPSLALLVADNARQQEVITEPIEAIFPETGNEQRDIDGGYDLSFVSLSPAIDFVVAGRIGITHRLSLHPELRASIPFGSVARGVPWSAQSFSASLGIAFNIVDNNALRNRVPPVASGGRPALLAEIVAYGIDESGSRYSNPVIEIEETPWVESVPLIPYIFFDSASADIPSRYVRFMSTRQTSGFDVDSLLAITPLNIHWQNLNIVGSRMLRDATLRLRITGVVSGDEAAGRTSGLASERATAVAGYLINIWGIDGGRITTTFALRTSTASPEETREGREENRRAELHFSDEHALLPVVVRRLATVASPPSVVFSPQIVADTTIAEWFISLVQGDREILRFEASNRSVGPREWLLSDLRVNRDTTPIRYRLTVRDVLGQVAHGEGAFRVLERQRRGQLGSSGQRTEVNEYSIVGFSYNSAELQPSHRALVGAIAPTIPSTARVTIVGHTDRVGDAVRNQQLSVERARRTHEALRAERATQGLAQIDGVSVVGLGGEREIFNNNLPEGRLLSRMVKIVVAKKTGDME